MADNYLVIWCVVILGIVIYSYWGSIKSKLPQSKKKGNLVGSQNDQRYNDLAKASKFYINSFV